MSGESIDEDLYEDIQENEALNDIEFQFTTGVIASSTFLQASSAWMA